MSNTPEDTELNEAIDNMLTWDIQGHTQPVLFQPEIKKAIKSLITLHTKEVADERELLTKQYIEQYIKYSAKVTTVQGIEPLSDGQYIRVDTVMSIINGQESIAHLTDPTEAGEK